MKVRQTVRKLFQTLLSSLFAQGRVFLKERLASSDFVLDTYYEYIMFGTLLYLISGLTNQIRLISPINQSHAYLVSKR